jgi:hypothetical protein
LTQINVTAKDIAKGTRGNVTSCPVARAFNRATKDCWKVTTSLLGDRSFARRQTRTIEVRLPERVHNFIRAFDEGEPVVPLRFNLEIPA